MGDRVESGDTVKFSFVGRIKDGSVFDESDEPMSIEVGTGKLIEGLDKEILGMAKGEEKKVTVSPEEGYGFEDLNFVTSVPLEAFKQNNIEPRVGMIFKTPQGNCRVTAVSDKDVELDYNHPLAGKTLIFDIKIEEIIKK